MVTLSVAGTGSWRKEDGELWIRVFGVDQEKKIAKGRLLLDRCLLRENRWVKKILVELRALSDEVISFELWRSTSQSIEFLQFVTSWSVNLAQWTQSGVARRWYKVRNGRQQQFDSLNEKTNEVSYCENENELQSSSAYICLAAFGAKNLDVECLESSQPKEATACKTSSFEFILPRVAISKSRELQAVRIGQIVNEVRFDILQDLIPLTLYGHDGNKKQPSAGTVTKLEDGMMKALVLLQLSCQYVNYCISELHQYSSKLENRKERLEKKKNRVKHRRKILCEQKINVLREVEGSTKSLGTVQTLLKELDPEILAYLQNDHEMTFEEVTESVDQHI
ncbi:putative Zinc finger protein DZIP1 [Plasmopara halstedii]